MLSEAFSTGAKHTEQEEETVKEQYAEVKMQLTTKRKKQGENGGVCLIDSWRMFFGRPRKTNKETTTTSTTTKMH